MIGNGISTPNFSSMVRTHAMCEYVLSIDSPRSSTLRSCSASAISAKAMNSVVQTGVKSAGWLNRTSQLPS